MSHTYRPVTVRMTDEQLAESKRKKLNKQKLVRMQQKRKREFDQPLEKELYV